MQFHYKLVPIRQKIPTGVDGSNQQQMQHKSKSHSLIHTHATDAAVPNDQLLALMHESSTHHGAVKKFNHTQSF